MARVKKNDTEEYTKREGIAEVTAVAINVRIRPSLDCEVVKTLPRGYRFKYINSMGGFYELASGGFVMMSYCEDIE